MFKMPLSNTSHHKGVFIGYCPVSIFMVANSESLSSRVSFVHSLDSTDRKLISLFSRKQGKLLFKVFCLAQKRQMIVIILTSYTAHLKPFGLTMSWALSGNTNSLSVIMARVLSAPQVLEDCHIVFKDENRGTQNLGLS